jgi:predicted double-glycine peptidase
MSKVIDYFGSRGFDTAYFSNGGAKSLERLRHYTDEGVPVIVLQRESIDSSRGHYRVVIGFVGDRVVVLDPASGILYIPEEDFMLLWRGNAETKYDDQMLVVKP